MAMQAYIPPEYMKLLIKNRSDTRTHKGHPTMEATPSFDVWSFGVVLYKLLTGFGITPRSRLNL